MSTKVNFSSYDEVVNYLFEQLPMYQRQGPKALKYDLSNITRLMEELDNPHHYFKSIHIAGTNGKGSTAHILSAIFQSNGYKTGLYTSPHYKDFRERIKLDGNFISKEYILDFVNVNKTLFEKLKPSYFELSVALAFCYFRSEAVDIAIIEVGLGGRLDSTNIITPMLSVITNISLDHTQTLGETLPQIAGEKAGIIKDNIPVLIGERQEICKPVFIEKAKVHNSPLHYADELIDSDQVDDYAKVESRGPFFKRNLKTALASVAVFKKYYPEWNFEAMNTSIAVQDLEKLTAYIGRWKLIGNKPLIIADGAHNLDSWEKTLAHLTRICPNEKKLHFVLGFVFDKDFLKILDLLPRKAKYYFSKADIPRALDPASLKDEAAKFGLTGQSYPTILKALKYAKQQAEASDIIFVGGSIFVVGEVM